MARKSGQIALLDIAIKVPCPECGEDVETSRLTFENKRDFICPHCAHSFWLTDEQHDKVFVRDGERIESIQKFFNR